MSKKASTGINWIVLTLVVVFGIGWGFYSPIQASVPRIGAYPSALATAFERELVMDQNTNYLFEKLIANTSLELSRRQIMSQLTSCGEHLGYPILMKPDGSCQSPATDEKRAYTDLLSAQYRSLQADTSLYDFSSISMSFSITERERKFYVQGSASGRLSRPLLSERAYSATLKHDPSFSLPSNYDFNLATSLLQRIRELYDRCKESENLANCINTNKDSLEFANLKLKETCFETEQEKFYQFIEYFLGCVNSVQQTCVCREQKPTEGTYDVIPRGDDVEIIGRISGKEYRHTLNNIRLQGPLESINENGRIIIKSTQMVVSPDPLLGQNQNELSEEQKTQFQSCTALPKQSFRLCLKDDNRPYPFTLLFSNTNIRAPDSLLLGYQLILDSTCDNFELSQQIESAMKAMGMQVVLATSKDDNKCQSRITQSELQTHIDPNYQSLFLFIDSGADLQTAYMLIEDNEPISSENKLLAKEISKSLGLTSEPVLLTETSLPLLVSFAVVSVSQTSNSNELAGKIAQGIKNYAARSHAQALSTSPNAPYYEAGTITFNYQPVVRLNTMIEDTVLLPGSTTPQRLMPASSLIRSPEIICGIAEKQGVNCALLAAILRTESSLTTINLPNDGKAHGLGQQFRAAVGDVLTPFLALHPDLASQLDQQYPRSNYATRDYPKKANADKALYIYNNILTSRDQEHLKMQIEITALYLNRVRQYLESQRKPTDARTIIQAYHDGTGNILPNGQSKLILAGNADATNYVPRVTAYYEGFRNRLEPRATS